MPENDSADTTADDTPTPEAPENDGATPEQHADTAAEKDWKAEADKWKALARKHEANYKQAAPAVQKLQELEDAQKSETQKLSDQLAEREIQLQTYLVKEIRNEAGQAAGLPPDMWEYITSADPEEAKAQAKRLAARIAMPEPGAANLRQGSRTPAKPPASANDALRAMAGYQQP